MGIKRIKINFGTDSVNSSPSLGDLTFYTKKEGTWQPYDIGSKISNTETDNILIETSSTGKASFNFTSLCTASSKYSFMSTSKTVESYVNIIFKTPLDVMNQIVYSTRYSSIWYCRSLQIEIYDEDDIVIYKNTSAPISSKDNQKVTLSTPDLEYIKTYATNKISYIETTDVNQLKSVFAINSVDIINKELEDNTYCRFLFSFDGRQTYKTFDLEDMRWIECDRADIINNGLSATDLKNTVYKYMSDALEETSTIDILVGLMSMNATKTPTISKITIDYLKTKESETE